MVVAVDTSLCSVDMGHIVAAVVQKYLAMAVAAAEGRAAVHLAVDIVAPKRFVWGLSCPTSPHRFPVRRLEPCHR